MTRTACTRTKVTDAPRVPVDAARHARLYARSRHRRVLAPGAGLPGSVDLVTYKPDASGRGTFLLTLTPGDYLAPISTGADWVLVLDTSGCVSGNYATLVDGVTQALGRMRADDRFGIVTFSRDARELTPGYFTVTTEHVADWAARVAAVPASGATNLYAGLDLGLRATDSDRPTGIVLVTDGVANNDDIVGEILTATSKLTHASCMVCG